MERDDRYAVAQLVESGALDEIFAGVEGRLFHIWKDPKSSEADRAVIMATLQALPEVKREFKKAGEG